MDFYENGGAATAKLLWSSSTQPKETIPGTQLLPYEDRTKPFVIAALADPSFQRVRLRFSESLDAVSCTDTQNYSISGGVTVLSAELQANRMDVVLNTTRQNEGTQYTITINGVFDGSDRFNPIADNSQVTFTSFITGQGFLRREVYTGLSEGTVDALRNLPKFPTIQTLWSLSTVSRHPRIGESITVNASPATSCRPFQAITFSTSHRTINRGSS
jgi:hypothetical protein